MTSQAERQAQSRANLQALLSGLEKEWCSTGNSLVLMQALAWCAREKMPTPEWAAEAMWEAVQRVVRLDAISWDAALGAPYSTGR